MLLIGHDVFLSVLSSECRVLQGQTIQGSYDQQKSEKTVCCTFIFNYVYFYHDKKLYYHCDFGSVRIYSLNLCYNVLGLWDPK